jgi:hypothetical protein
MNAPIRPVISFGVTLARKLDGLDTMTAINRIPAERLVGEVHVAIVKSHVPDVLNVECWPDNIGPVTVIAALEIAHRRMKILHQTNGHRLQFQAVDLYDAEHMRRTAEQLVDMCRSGRIGGFDQSRENCVRVVMAALASASSKTTEAPMMVEG